MRSVFPKVSSAEMRGINRSAVMEYLRTGSPTFRSAIARALNISLPTVMKIVDELVSEGLVVETEEREPSGGRRRRLLKFDAGGNLVVGVDMGGTKVYGAVATMEGKILCEKTLVHHASRREESFDILAGFIDQLLEEARRFQGRVRGIGVGVPGVVDLESGAVKVCPALNWDHFPLQERLNDRYSPGGHGPTVLVENDVNLAALGELWFGLDEEVENLALVAIGTGVGAGIIINGMVYPGAQGIAGEIGYLLPDRSSLDQRYPGFGAIEKLIAGPGIAEQARQILKEKTPGEDMEQVSSEMVFAAARAGENWAAQVLSETVNLLAQALAAIQLVLDPEIILLSGGVAREADLLIGPVLERLEGRIPHLPRLQASRLGYRAGVLGAVVKVFRRQVGLYRVIKVI